MSIEQMNDFISKLETNATNDWRNAKGVLRYGQCLFNTLYDLDSELANKIRGTNNDPFYLDEKIPKFFFALEELLIEKFVDLN